MPTASGIEITDPRSARVRAARRLRKRAFREAEGAFLAEGPQAVREAIADAERRADADSRAAVHSAAAGPGIRDIFADGEAARRHADLLHRARSLRVPVHRASGHVLAALSETVTPQGLVAVCDMRHRPLTDVVSGRADEPTHLVAVLADVRDPGNAGTVVRTADAAGADAVIFAGASVDPYNGKCVRATAGSLFHVGLAAGPTVADAVTILRGGGLRVVAADGGADTDLYDAERSGALAGPTAWLFGNEAWGLPVPVRDLADLAVRVPIHGRAESLNLAAAAAVCLYTSARIAHVTTG